SASAAGGGGGGRAGAAPAPPPPPPPGGFLLGGPHSPPAAPPPPHTLPLTAVDAGVTVEGDHRGALGLGPAQHRLHLRAVARQRHQVGRVLELPPEPEHDVTAGLAQGPRHALVLLVGAESPE